MDSNPDEVPPPVPLPDVVNGEGEFRFPNGDSYKGGFEAKKNGFIITRQGYGEYTTWDGHVYKGPWEDDQLHPNEDIVIEFCDRSGYEGKIRGGKYSGAGTYTFPDTSSFRSHFLDNVPAEEGLLADKEGFQWIGEAREDAVQLLSLNKFYVACPGKSTAAEQVVEDIEELAGDNVV